MGRSTSKGPYVEERLEKRVEELNRQRQKKVLKTWSRRSTIVPEFVGHTLAVQTAGSSSPSTSPRTWWATAWASSR